jgi:hypothetical protein
MGKRKRQRPRKKKDGSNEDVMYLRIGRTITDAMERHRANLGMATRAEAVREMLAWGAKERGLIE